jgi:uncharacterized membrane protein
MYSIFEKIKKQLIFGLIILLVVLTLVIFSIIINYQKQQLDIKKKYTKRYNKICYVQLNIDLKHGITIT